MKKMVIAAMFLIAALAMGNVTEAYTDNTAAESAFDAETIISLKKTPIPL